VVPRILALLKEHDLTITFFVVGRDAEQEENYDALRAIADAGHEIANHSYSHEPWLHLYSENDVETEIARTEEHIERTTGGRPVGFRGPGYSHSVTALRVLARRDYAYDASTFPNLLNPLARLYYFVNSNLSREEKRQRKALFGTVRDAMRPIKPYLWRIDGKQLAEIPVTTMPLFRVPVHFTYLLWMSKFSATLARLYFRAALALCRLTATSPSLLLHPLDFMGSDDDGDLAFFPGMDLPSSHKMALLGEFIRSFTSRYRVMNMTGFAANVTQREDLEVLEPTSNRPQ
jgi:hypothetical protein